MFYVLFAIDLKKVETLPREKHPQEEEIKE